MKGHPSRNVDLRSDSVLASDSSKSLDEQTAITVEQREPDPARFSVPSISLTISCESAYANDCCFSVGEGSVLNCVELFESFVFVYIFVCERCRLININGEFKMGMDRKTKPHGFDYLAFCATEFFENNLLGCETFGVSDSRTISL